MVQLRGSYDPQRGDVISSARLPWPDFLFDTSGQSQKEILNWDYCICHIYIIHLIHPHMILYAFSVSIHHIIIISITIFMIIKDIADTPAHILLHTACTHMYISARYTHYIIVFHCNHILLFAFVFRPDQLQLPGSEETTDFPPSHFQSEMSTHGKSGCRPLCHHGS